MREAEIQRYIVKRIDLALRGRSWNWLSEKSGVRQSTLATQRNTSGDSPRVTLSTLVAIAPVLKKPVDYFLPPNLLEGAAPEDPIPEMALERIGQIVDWSRTAESLDDPMPAALERAMDVHTDVVPRVQKKSNGNTARPSTPARKAPRKEG
jgi:hypothetical protein